MELRRNALMDALSLTRERVRVWVFGRCQIHKRTGAEGESGTWRF
jgi:hypothetical protein